MTETSILWDLHTIKLFWVEPSTCRKLAKHAIQRANQRFIAKCLDLSGMIGNLECNYSLVEAVDTREFPIDLVVLDLGHEVINVKDEQDNNSGSND